MRIRYIVLLLVVGGPVLFAAGRWVLATIMALRNGPTKRCPQCGKTCTRWSMRRFYDRSLPSFVLPRRCDFCNSRFYVARPVNYARRTRVRAAQPEPAQAPVLQPVTPRVAVQAAPQPATVAPATPSPQRVTAMIARPAQPEPERAMAIAAAAAPAEKSSERSIPVAPAPAPGQVKTLPAMEWAMRRNALRKSA